MNIEVQVRTLFDIQTFGLMLQSRANVYISFYMLAYFASSVRSYNQNMSQDDSYLEIEELDADADVSTWFPPRKFVEHFPSDYNLPCDNISQRLPSISMFDSK